MKLQKTAPARLPRKRVGTWASPRSNSAVRRANPSLPRALRTSLAIAVLATAAILITLGSCSSVRSVPYAETYLAALDTHAGVPVKEAHFDPFIAFIGQMGEPGWEARFDGVYAGNIHFNDTLATISDRNALKKYFSGLHDAGTKVSVNVLTKQYEGQDGYLLWEMRSTFKPLFRSRTSHTIGMTHLRFNASGEVILQQDYWDAAAGFYEHIPVLGGAVRAVQGRLQP